MRTVDPITQCENVKTSPMVYRMMAYALPYMSIAEAMGMFKMPRIKGQRRPPWSEVNLSKEERKLSQEDREELRRYRWTLEMMYKEQSWTKTINQ